MCAACHVSPNEEAQQGEEIPRNSCSQLCRRPSPLAAAAVVAAAGVSLRRGIPGCGDMKTVKGGGRMWLIVLA